MLLMGSFASGVSFILFGYDAWQCIMCICVDVLFMHTTVLNSLVTMISADGGIFVAMCFILRILEGTAGAMFSTASCALVIALYPDNIGLVMVSFVSDLSMSCAKYYTG